MTTRHAITAGFVPLLDSALLVVAREKGFAEAEGVDLTLVRERSWASIRDRLAVSHFDVAHILGPMPIACNLGLSAPAPADHAAKGGTVPARIEIILRPLARHRPPEGGGNRHGIAAEPERHGPPCRPTQRWRP
jgi:hypothetical protein